MWMIEPIKNTAKSCTRSKSLLYTADTQGNYNKIRSLESYSTLVLRVKCV